MLAGDPLEKSKGAMRAVDRASDYMELLFVESIVFGFAR